MRRECRQGQETANALSMRAGPGNGEGFARTFAFQQLALGVGAPHLQLGDHLAKVSVAALVQLRQRVLRDLHAFRLRDQRDSLRDLADVGLGKGEGESVLLQRPNLLVPATHRPCLLAVPSGNGAENCAFGRTARRCSSKGSAPSRPG